MRKAILLNVVNVLKECRFSSNWKMFENWVFFYVLHLKAFNLMCVAFHRICVVHIYTSNVSSFKAIHSINLINCTCIHNKTQFQTESKILSKFELNNFYWLKETLTFTTRKSNETLNLHEFCFLYSECDSSYDIKFSKSFAFSMSVYFLNFIFRFPDDSLEYKITDTFSKEAKKVISISG